MFVWQVGVKSRSKCSAETKPSLCNNIHFLLWKPENAVDSDIFRPCLYKVIYCKCNLPRVCVCVRQIWLQMTRQCFNAGGQRRVLFWCRPPYWSGGWGSWSFPFLCQSDFKLHLFWIWWCQTEFMEHSQGFQTFFRHCYIHLKIYMFYPDSWRLVWV